MLAHVPSFGRNPRGSPDFLAYPVPKACMHVLGTRVPRRLGVARSASSPKAAQALGCSLTPGLRISFGRVTCMARAASVPGLWALGFLLLACVCGWVRVAVGRGFCLPLPVLAGVLGGCVWAPFLVLSLFCRLFVVFVVGLWCRPAFGTCVVSCAFPLPPALSGSGVWCGRACWARVSAVPRPSWLGCRVMFFALFFFFFPVAGCPCPGPCGLFPRLLSFGLGCWLFFFFFCLFRCPFFRWAAVFGLVLPVLAGWSPCACLGVLSSVPSGWGGFGPLLCCWRAVWWLWRVFARPCPPPLFFFFFWGGGGGGSPSCSSLCLPSAGVCSVAGVWCGWSLATPGGGSCVLLPATPGWVSLPVVVGGPRHSWLGSAGGGGVWCVAVVCWWGCGWCVVWLVPRHSWRRFLCATPRHSWLGFASAGGGRSPPLLAGVRLRRWCVVCGVWCVVCWWGCGWCVVWLVPRHSWRRFLCATPRHSWLGFAAGGGGRSPPLLAGVRLRRWCVVCGVWCVAVVCWWGCGWCVVWLVPRHSWRRFLCATPRHSWLGFAAGGGGRSPPLLAGVRLRRWCVVCGVWRWCVGGVAAGVWCGWSLATAGGGSCVLLPATPGWVSLPVVVGGPRHSWLGSACGVGVWCVAVVCWWGCGWCVVWLVPRHSWRRSLCATPRHSWLGFAAGGGGRSPPLLAGVRGRRWCVVCGVLLGSLATPGGGPCVLLPATPGWVSLPLVVGGPRHSWLGSAGGGGVRALLGRVGRAGLPGAFWCASPFPLAALCFCFAWPPPGWGCPSLFRCCCRSSLAGVCGVWVGCCLAPVRVPWFVACCARSPGLWHPAAVAAWHLSVCLGCGRRRASLACLVAPRGAPRLVRSGRSRCSGRLSRRRGAFPHPGSLRPRLYWAAARGTRRPAENRAHCACRWPPPRQGRWARSASYPFGAPRWGCPWRVPPAPVLGCVRCGGWRVWTRSLTRPVSRTVRLSTGDSAGAPGLFRVDADTSRCGSEDATPGSRACLRVLALLGRVGRAGLPGAFWCASPFPLAALSFCFAWPPPGWGCPSLFRCLPFLVGCFSRPPAAWLAPLLCPPLGRWLLFGGCSPAPPPFVSRVFVAPACGLGVFFFFSSSSVRPRCLRLSLVSGPGCPGPRRLRCLFCWPSASWLSVRLSLFRAFPLAVGCSRVVAAPPPPPLVSRGFCSCRSVLFAVLCCASPGAVLRRAAARCVARCCAVRVVRAAAGAWCCGALLCVVLFPVVCRGAVLSLSGRVVCFPVVGVVCRGALLSCVVFYGAVLSRGAVLLCSAVVLRRCWGLLCPPVGRRAVLCCAVGGLCCFWPGGGVCVLWCSFPRAVRSLSSPLCALRCLVVLAVVPCFPVSCAVALCCRVVLCCRALLSFCGAVCVCFALLRPVVRRLCRLRCCWCLVLWRVPVRCGVSLGVLRCGGAALVCRGVLLCCALSCGVLRSVPCPAVPCCPAVLCWLAVLCGCLRCWCLFCPLFFC